jgi:hypothetical protein
MMYSLCSIIINVTIVQIRTVISRIMERMEYLRETSMMLRLTTVVAWVVGLGVYPSEAVWQDAPLDRAAPSVVLVDMFH